MENKRDYLSGLFSAIAIQRRLGLIEIMVGCEFSTNLQIFTQKVLESFLIQPLLTLRTSVSW